MCHSHSDPGVEPPIDEIVSVQRVYWRRIAESVRDDVAVNHWIDEDGHPLPRGLFREIALYLSGIVQGNGGHILEVACGNGLILSELSQVLKGRWVFHGLDLSLPMLLRANQAINVRFCCSQAASLPFKNESFEMIYMHSLLQYLSSRQHLDRVMEESLRVLKRGGSLCIMDVPLTWYANLFGRTGIGGLSRKRLSHLAHQCCPGLLRSYRRRKRPLVENIDGVEIPFPHFSGLLADPDYFYHYSPMYDRVSIELQPFHLKPLRYRKSRLNVLMEGKK